MSRPEQLADNIAALDLRLSDDHRPALDSASAPNQGMLYSVFTPALRQQVVFGGSSVRSWAEWAREWPSNAAVT